MMLVTTEAAFSQLLISGTLVHEGSFKEVQQKFGIQVTPHLAILISMDRYPELAIDKSITWKTEIGQQLVKAVYQTISEPFLWVWIEEGILALLLELASDSQQSPSLKRKLLSNVQQIQGLVDSQGFSVSAGIGSYYESPYMLYRSFEEAKESLVDRFFQGNRVIYFYEKSKKVDLQAEQAVSQEEKTELLARVRIGDIEGSINYLKMLLARIAQTYKFHIDMFKSAAIELSMSLSSMVLETGGDVSIILSENARMIQSLYSTVRYNNFVNKLCDYWRMLAEQIVKANQLNVSPIIRKAMNHILEYHQDKISLEDIAQYCYVSTYHLAHLFKKEVGVSVIDFLNKIRIEKAVYYLEMTEMSVKQIAGLVGFQDSNYFTRTFKKIMSCSPSDYRTARLC
ncbi:response regulator transcription factor [Bacillus sp. FJAT-26390]|uniref:response regulator transcription factor n=1 Tax=Bacillus sp. FJAT-26390 TaxID=1743142 RepID=UPI000807FAC4|nr:response regulator transcription factor [Bacillus sp. FJAT-26390]OBZ16974.1 AraC family transcriptional regulator [Bacillus sp. FJAT-26390]